MYQWKKENKEQEEPMPYLFTKEDKSLVKLAEGVAMPYSTVTLDSIPL